MRKGIEDGMKRANEDSNVKAVVIHGRGRTFPAGADITEFGGMRERRDGLFYFSLLYVQYYTNILKD